MTDNITLFRRELMHSDTRNELAIELFNARVERKLTLSEVAQQTGLTVEAIDSLECYNSDIDFNEVAKLLDFYQIQLGMNQNCFPGLPEEMGEKYFEE